MALQSISTKVSLFQRATSQTRRLCDGFARMNIYKDVSKAPKELDDSEYPEWLWKVLDQQPTKQELLREAEQHYHAGGYDAVFSEMSEEKLKRLFKLDRRERIKQENERRRGGRVV